MLGPDPQSGMTHTHTPLLKFHSGSNAFDGLGAGGAGKGGASRHGGGASQTHGESVPLH